MTNEDKRQIWIDACQWMLATIGSLTQERIEAEAMRRFPDAPDAWITRCECGRESVTTAISLTPGGISVGHEFIERVE